MQGANFVPQVTYYPLGAQVMTLILPLGFFIIVMIGLYFVFSRPHTVPGRRPITGARPVAPSADIATTIAAASGLPTATGAGGPEPLAQRATPPAVGARSGETVPTTDEQAQGEKNNRTGEPGQDGNAAAEGSEDQE